MDERSDALTAWVTGVVAGEIEDIRLLAGDASFRRYFRVITAEGGTLVAMDAPPPHEDVRPFVAVAGMLENMGLLAPRIISSDVERGFLLLSDLGDRTYLSELGPDNVDPLYTAAMQALVTMQAQGQSHAAALPPYDRRLLLDEMGLFREWYLGRHVALKLRRRDIAALQAAFDYLADMAVAQPRVFVHRDYHSRNLMVTPSGTPGILDFQDAVNGPVAYDLVSLLRDCYIAWPEERVRGWVREYLALAAAAEVDTGMNEDAFMHAFFCMGAQRHLKAVGIFARLHHRDGKDAYLADIPRTIGYLRHFCADCEPLVGLGEVIERSLDAAAA